MSTKLCLLALVLVAATNVISLPVNVGKPSDNVKNMLPLENEYLRYLYQTIEDSGRQPSENGEVNLLREETKRFANMVQCVAEIDNEDTDEVTVSESIRRTVTYNLIHNFISSTQKLVAFRLVIPSCPSPSLYQVNVYATTSSESPEDSGSSREKYLDLNVEIFDQLPFEANTMYQLVLEVTSPDGSMDDDALADILKSLKPMLVVYSYDNNLLKNLFQTPNTKVLRKRDVQDVPPPTELTGPTLEERKKEFCQVHTVNLTSFDPWIDPNFEALNPGFASMSFCYGHCKSSVENAKRITDHAKFVGRMNPQLIEAGISPCCIPTGYRMTKLEFRPVDNGNIIMTIIYNHVTSCRCY